VDDTKGQRDLPELYVFPETTKSPITTGTTKFRLGFPVAGPCLELEIAEGLMVRGAPRPPKSMIRKGVEDGRLIGGIPILRRISLGQVHGRGNKGGALHRCPNCRDKVRSQRLLQNVAQSAGEERSFNKLRFRIYGQKYHPRPGTEFPKAASSFDPVLYRHGDVQDQNIGGQAGGKLNCFCAILRSADDAELFPKSEYNKLQNLFLVIR